MARLHEPTSGRVLAGDTDVWRMRRREAAHRIALLPQSPQAPEVVSVAGLVRYGRRPHQSLLRQWSRDDERAVTEALADRRYDRARRPPARRTLRRPAPTLPARHGAAQETPVVLLDEPTSALDIGHAVKVLELVRAVAAGGRTVVMVVHDLAAAARYADTVVAMRDGRVVASGPPRETIDPALVRELHGIDTEILFASSDGAPVVVPTAAPLT